MTQSGFITVDAQEGDRIVAERCQAGWRVFRLPANIASKNDFFIGVRQTFPLEPPLQGNHSWDALADSLWAGLDGLSDENILIVWSNFTLMERAVPGDYAIANEVLRDVSQSLSDAAVTAGATKQLVVLHVI